MRLIVDSDGSVWSAYDEKLLERWGYPDPDFDLPSFAVRNLGAIDVRLDESTINVSFRWLTVKPEALTAVMELLPRLPPHEVKIRCEAGTWVEETFGTAAEAAEWIKANDILSRGGVGRNMLTKPRHLRALSERPLAKIEEPDDRLALMFKKWRLAHGRFDGDTATFLVRFGLIDRTLVVSESDSNRELFFEHVGAGFALYENTDDSWIYRAQGLRVTDQLDPDFGRWIDHTYHDVLDVGTPRFDYVDTVIQARGAEPYRFCYDRLLLPWQNGEGRRVITGTSYNRQVDRVA
jgi:hypothetical protein